MTGEETTRSKWFWWLMGIVATVIAATIITTLHLSGTGSTPGGTSGGSATPTADVSYSPTSNSSPAPLAAPNPFTAGSDHLPSQLTGTWIGSIFQASTSETYSVTLKLAQNPGTMIGTSSYPTLNCEGILRLNQVTFDTVIVTEYITFGAAGTTSATGNGCITPLQISLKYLDKNHLLYTFAYGGNATDGQATLKRS